MMSDKYEYTHVNGEVKPEHHKLGSFKRRVTETLCSYIAMHIEDTGKVPSAKEYTAMAWNALMNTRY